MKGNRTKKKTCTARGRGIFLEIFELLQDPLRRHETWFLLVCFTSRRYFSLKNQKNIKGQYKAKGKSLYSLIIIKNEWLINISCIVAVHCSLIGLLYFAMDPTTLKIIIFYILFFLYFCLWIGGLGLGPFGRGFTWFFYPLTLPLSIKQ